MDQEQLNYLLSSDYVPSGAGLQMGNFGPNLNYLGRGMQMGNFGPNQNYIGGGIQTIFPSNMLPTLSNLGGITPSYGVANEQDDEQDQEYIDQVNQSNNKFGGIMDLIGSIAIPGYGFFKNIARGGLEGLKGFGRRLGQSDFAQSPTLADYFDARSYGGRDARDRAASQNMREARAIQTQVDRRGDSTSRVSDRNRSSVTTSSAAKSKGVGGGGYTKSDSARESYRGRF